jgi:DNA repair exonuclease SbcCD ATPase subunit
MPAIEERQSTIDEKLNAAKESLEQYEKACNELDERIRTDLVTLQVENQNAETKLEDQKNKKHILKLAMIACAVLALPILCGSITTFFSINNFIIKTSVTFGICAAFILSFAIITILFYCKIRICNSTLEQIENYEANVYEKVNRLRDEFMPEEQPQAQRE